MTPALLAAERRQALVTFLFFPVVKCTLSSRDRLRL